jgi:hypothetical protein
MLAYGTANRCALVTKLAADGNSKTVDYLLKYAFAPTWL